MYQVCDNTILQLEKMLNFEKTLSYCTCKYFTKKTGYFLLLNFPVIRSLSLHRSNLDRDKLNTGWETNNDSKCLSRISKSLKLGQLSKVSTEKKSAPTRADDEHHRAEKLQKKQVFMSNNVTFSIIGAQISLLQEDGPRRDERDETKFSDRSHLSLPSFKKEAWGSKVLISACIN